MSKKNYEVKKHKPVHRRKEKMVFKAITKPTEQQAHYIGYSGKV